jgi:hypothetical protein
MGDNGLRMIMQDYHCLYVFLGIVILRKGFFCVTVILQSFDHQTFGWQFLPGFVMGDEEFAHAHANRYKVYWQTVPEYQQIFGGFG